MSFSTNAEYYYGIIVKSSFIFKQFTNVPIEIESGNLVQVISDLGDQIYIKIFSLQGGTLLWSTDLFLTKKCNVLAISIKLWEILLGVKHPDKRSLIIQNGEGFTKYLLGIYIGSPVTISRSALNRSNDIQCIVRYIGHVPEIGPGVYFGFEFTDPTEKLKPRNNLPKRYCKCDNSRSFIRAADCFLNVAQPGLPANNNKQLNMRNISMQPATNSDLPTVSTRKKPNGKNTGNRKGALEVKKNQEIEELRKTVELLELQVKEKALKEELENDWVLPSKPTVHNQRKPKNHNNQHRQNRGSNQREQEPCKIS